MSMSMVLTPTMAGPGLCMCLAILGTVASPLGPPLLPSPQPLRSLPWETSCPSTTFIQGSVLGILKPFSSPLPLSQALFFHSAPSCPFPHALSSSPFVQGLFLSLFFIIND